MWGSEGYSGRSFVSHHSWATFRALDATLAVPRRTMTHRRHRVPSSHAQPPRRRDQPVPPPARAQPGRLVSVGSRRARRGEAARPADLPVDRLRGLPLVSRDGTRVVRARADGALPERPLRLDQGRSRGAARPRPGLHGGGPVDDRRWRLADVGLPDARRAGRSTAAPTSPTSRATGCRRSGRCSRASIAPGASSGPRSRRRAGGWSRRSSSRARLEAGPDDPTPALLDGATAGHRAPRSTRRTAAGAGRPSSRSR